MKFMCSKINYVSIHVSWNSSGKLYLVHVPVLVYRIKVFKKTCNFIIILLHVVLKEKQLFYMYLWQESVTRMSRTWSWWADRNCVLFSIRTISTSPKAATDTASFTSIWMKLSPFLRHHSLHKVTKLWYILSIKYMVYWT